MDRRKRLSADIAYETLLTILVQQGLASVWSPTRMVADPDRARHDVVTYATIFGSPVIQLLVGELNAYIKKEELQSRLSPFFLLGGRFDSVLQIKLSASNLVIASANKDVLVWDSGRATRMGRLMMGGKSKGDLELWGKYKLYQLSASPAKWLVNTLRNMGKEYIAFVASDQVVCLKEQVKQKLKAFLRVACKQNADMIFFDAPPALSIVRLYHLVSRAKRPRNNSAMAVARDRTLLKHYGGAHVFQCVLFKKHLCGQLARVLQSILNAANKGYYLDWGIADVAILPHLIWPKWIERDRHPAALAVGKALRSMHTEVKQIFPIALPVEVYNVNSRYVLERLRKKM